MLCCLPTGFRRRLDPRVVCSIAVPIACICDRCAGPSSHPVREHPPGQVPHVPKYPAASPALVVSSSTARCCWLAVVALLFLTLCCPTLGCFFSPALTYHQTHPSPDHPPYTITLFRPRIYDAATHRQHQTPPSPKVFTSRPLGTAPANHPTLPNPTRAIDVIDTGQLKPRHNHHHHQDRIISQAVCKSPLGGAI